MNRSGVGRGGNPWNMGSANQNNHNERNGSSRTVRNSEDIFQTAQKKMQASVQKHLQKEYESSSDEEELDSEPIVKAVLKDYKVLTEKQGLEKVQLFLENSFQSGAGICLICIASIKRLDPIWSCIECYGSFHLNCLQKWSKDSIFQQKEAQEDLPEFRKSHKINWACPKCRHEYDQSEVPQKYFCFCGKTQDPTYQPFLVPHSCGERCDKSLKPECGHSCLLLCHPGPCPPCPKTVQTSCHCGKHGPKTQRCNKKQWSCGEKCKQPLLCKKHLCAEACHAGECPPCEKKSIQECNCGLQKREQPCMTPVWQCNKVCGKAFSCGFHKCEVKCHAGGCGDCPRSLDRTCPCGKSVSKLPCTVDIPACNETCSKLLDCQVHYCSQKCHKGKCGMCLEIVVKSCRCGHHKKELPCQKEFLCESKCKRMKNCSRHSCNRKCCDSFCPPCEKQCGRTLSCGNHRCPAMCHRGRCYPCPEVVQIKCRCGRSVISVPCSQKRRTKPPKCNEICSITPSCHHPSSVPHRCHFGDCPPCVQVCGKDLKGCSHKCPASCHSAVWQEINKNPNPTGPWEAFQSQMKRCNLPCPDCLVPMPVTCLGGHETVNRPCFQSKPEPCSRSCGRLLSCTNHLCEKQCHKVTGSGDAQLAGKDCSRCELQCGKDRPDGCTHRCPDPCHPGECSPCEAKLKMKCHCGVGFVYIRCSDYTSANDVTKEKLKSCGSSCPKNYPCGHRCRSNCHSGDCPEAESCKKKVKMTCPCGIVKKDFSCHLVRSGSVQSIDCNDLCLAKMTDKQEKEDELKKKQQEEEMKRNQEDLERFERKFQGKKRSKQRTNSSSLSSKSKRSVFIEHWYFSVGVMVAIAVTLVYLMSQ